MWCRIILKRFSPAFFLAWILFVYGFFLWNFLPAAFAQGKSRFALNSQEQISFFASRAWARDASSETEANSRPSSRLWKNILSVAIALMIFLTAAGIGRSILGLTNMD